MRSAGAARGQTRDVTAGGPSLSWDLLPQRETATSDQFCAVMQLSVTEGSDTRGRA